MIRRLTTAVQGAFRGPRRSLRPVGLGLCLAGALAGCAAPTPPDDGGNAACLALAAPAGARVLVFSRTLGFRHASIPAGVEAIRALGARHGFDVAHSEDPLVFHDDALGGYSAVVFLNTTGDVLGDAAQAAFERYVRAGGGFVGVHSAADTEYDWAWYGRMVGAYFARHPDVQPATVQVLAPEHPSTRCLPAEWRRTDEWYDYRARPAAGVAILATLDEASYGGGRMGEPHPIAWYHDFDGGRAWYTGMGHTSESYAEPEFLDHLAGGILSVLRR